MAEKKAAAKVAADAKKHWTCTHCGDTRCFVTRKECRQRGKPRHVPTQPGLEQPAAAAAAADHEMVGQAEVPLEERIAGLDHDIKGMKAINLKTQQLVETLGYSEADRCGPGRRTQRHLHVEEPLEVGGNRG